jgi:4-amino-4-deoxy-L-arabinose transferase-like glycosyltransferase
MTFRAKPTSAGPDAGRLSIGLLTAISAIPFIAHVLTNGNYGMFRDEFYYLACAYHPAWGYVDHPPLAMIILNIWTRFFGDSVWSIRFLPALAGAAVVFLTGALAHALGGRRYAQGLAALCAAICPTYLVVFGMYSMNWVDVLVWLLAFHLLARIAATDGRRTWLWMGVLLGVGLLNKISVIVLGFAIAAAALLTPMRSHLRRRYTWIAAGFALALFVPHLLWQVAHGWPTLEFIENAKRYKISDHSPLEFLFAQFMGAHPGTVLIWGTGLLALFFWYPLRRFRVLGWIYLAAFAVFVLQKSKAYYLTPAYPALWAAGAVALESWWRKPSAAWAKPVTVGLVALTGVAVAPLVLPALPPDTLISYQSALGLSAPKEENHGETTLDQHFADRFGWENMAEVVAGVYDSLSPEERAVIVASNYGEAGAIEYYSRQYDLPRVISGHNNYALWIPDDLRADVFIMVGFDAGEIDQLFESIEEAALVVSPFAMPYETNLRVLVARGLKVPFEEARQAFRFYI